MDSGARRRQPDEETTRLPALVTEEEERPEVALIRVVMRPLSPDHEVVSLADLEPSRL